MSWEEEIPFILLPNEEVVLKNQYCSYVGQKIVLKTSGWGSSLGGSINTGMGALSSSIGSFSGKTKQEKEADRQSLSMFVTDRRLVFVNYKVNWRGKKIGWGDMYSEIPYEYITSIKQDKWKWLNNLRLNVGVGDDIKRIDLYAFNTHKKEEQLKILSNWEQTIQQGCENARNRAQTVPVVKSESPIQVLKLRLAKGEITKEEYEQLLKILEY